MRDSQKVFVMSKSLSPPVPKRPPMDPLQGVRRIPLAPHQMTASITASEDLFVLAHLGVPRVDPAHWSLVVEGLVGRPVRLALDDLRRRPKTIVESMHQCCGNPLEPRVAARRIANVRWGGVDLAALLSELEVDFRARYLWSYGLDGGDFAGRRCDWYVKDLPLTRLAADGVLLAYELNGAPLSAEHGFPLRLVVPGYYGTNSVKWLWRLQLAEQRAEGPFTSDLYNDPVDASGLAAGLPSHQPVWAIAPESIIVAPGPDGAVTHGETSEIWGWAWSFRGIAGVEVSVDGGDNFRRATLSPRRNWSWQRFSLPWRPDRPGRAALCVRAFETGGAAQPQDGARNAIHTVQVVVG